MTLVSLLFFLLSGFRVLWWMYFIALALMIWSAFRTLSRNIAARQRERIAYLRLTAKPRAARALQKNKWRDRKTHVYKRCPKCKNILRLPRVKGKHTAACPCCGNRFDVRI
jgi:hypothetical protein